MDDRGTRLPADAIGEFTVRRIGTLRRVVEQIWPTC